MFGQSIGKLWQFDGAGHTEAMNRLCYVAEQGEEFVLLLAERGCGKTTVLKQVQAHCSRMGHSIVLINVAALDETSFLWHLCGALSISVKREQKRSELMKVVRDELSGRALCNHRTIVILDDLHSTGADLGLMIQFLTAVNQQTNGAVSVIAAAEQSLPQELRKLSALKVCLPLLNDDESRDFVTGLLVSEGIATTQITADGLDAVVNYGGGSPAHLTRICELLKVAQATQPEMIITSEQLAALTEETLPV